MCQKRNCSFVVLVTQMRNIAFGVREGESKSLVRDGQLPFSMFSAVLFITRLIIKFGN